VGVDNCGPFSNSDGSQENSGPEYWIKGRTLGTHQRIVRGTPQENGRSWNVADMGLFLASDEAKYITVRELWSMKESRRNFLSARLNIRIIVIIKIIIK